MALMSTENSPQANTEPLTALVTVAGRPRAACLDSGETVSLVSMATVTQMQLHYVMSEPGTECQILVASLQSLPVIGRAILPLTTEDGLDFPIQVLVTEKLLRPIILGNDFLSTMSSVEIDYDDAKIYLKNPRKGASYSWRLRTVRRIKPDTGFSPAWQPQETMIATAVVTAALIIIIFSLGAWLLSEDLTTR
jgi:hypothetical protein